jgi:hypothetical protein
MFISSPEKFADLFNARIPDACRKITADDVRLMTKCNLIGRYRSYGRQDLETTRAILQYELLREHRPVQQDKEKKPHAANPAGNHYLQTRQVRPDGLKNNAPVVNPTELKTAKRG